MREERVERDINDREIHNVVGEIECSSFGFEFLGIRMNELAELFRKMMKGLEKKPAMNNIINGILEELFGIVANDDAMG